jgi:hypothetical protein
MLSDILWFYVRGLPWFLVTLLGIVCLAAGVWVYFDAREAKGLSFEEIDVVYQGKSMKYREDRRDRELQAMAITGLDGASDPLVTGVEETRQQDNELSI